MMGIMFASVSLAHEEQVLDKVTLVENQACKQSASHKAHHSLGRNCSEGAV